jgi:uncharacterized protein (TIGR02145 family)
VANKNRELNIGGFMPFCSKCGTEVPENDNFCPKCGNASQSKQNSIIKSALPFLVGGGAIVIIVFLFLFVGESKYVEMVKKGSINACPSYTIEEIVNSAMDKPKWEHITANNGADYVNISGLFTLGKPTNGVLQFWVRDNSLGVNALELDKEPQNNFGVTILINAMCNAVSSKRVEKKKEEAKDYKTVKIGKQIWMVENLNYEMGKSKCHGNKPTNCEKYGRLYDWKTAMKVCPKGWHLPSDAEWQTLVDFAGGNEVAGKKLKTKTGWNKNKLNQNENSFVLSGDGEDKFGFSALPGGGDGYDSADSEDFDDIGRDGNWWSSSEEDDDYAYSRSMTYNSNGVSRGFSDKSLLFSVRCVKD